jgi:hypothetical protein
MRVLYYTSLLLLMILGVGCWNHSKPKPTVHYMLYAKQGQVELLDAKDRLTLLTLKDVRTTVNFFASKPKPVSGAISLREFLLKWNQLHSYYRQVTLSSVILFEKKELDISELIVEVVNLEWDAKEKVLRFVVKGEFEKFEKAHQSFKDLTVLINIPQEEVPLEG